MTLYVYARRRLAEHSCRRHNAGVLLEGSMARGGQFSNVQSIDESLDTRYAWIDELARTANTDELTFLNKSAAFKGRLLILEGMACNTAAVLGRFRL